MPGTQGALDNYYYYLQLLSIIHYGEGFSQHSYTKPNSHSQDNCDVPLSTSSTCARLWKSVTLQNTTEPVAMFSLWVSAHQVLFVQIPAILFVQKNFFSSLIAVRYPEYLLHLGIKPASSATLTLASGFTTQSPGKPKMQDTHKFFLTKQDTSSGPYGFKKYNKQKINLHVSHHKKNTYSISHLW